MLPVSYYPAAILRRIIKQRFCRFQQVYRSPPLNLQAQHLTHLRVEAGGISILARLLRGEQTPQAKLSDFEKGKRPQ